MTAKPFLLLLCALAACRPRAAHGSGEASSAPQGSERRGSAYDRYRQPERLVRMLGIRPGQSVADVGAATGYLTFRLADAVGPGGRVVATDVDEAAVRAIADRAARRGATNVSARRVAADHPGLELAAYDLVLLAEVDHLLADRAAFLRAIAPSLRPGGRIAIENRLPYHDAVLSAAHAAGLCLERERFDLPAHFLLLFDTRGPCVTH